MGNGPNILTVENASNVQEIPVAAAAVVYTKAFSLEQGEYFALAYKATSDGDVKLKIELQQSYKLPDTEGSAEDAWIEPDGLSDIESSLADELWHIKQISPKALPYGRLKITGLGAPNANDATTTIKIKLGILDY